MLCVLGRIYRWQASPQREGGVPSQVEGLEPWWQHLGASGKLRLSGMNICSLHHSPIYNHFQLFRSWSRSLSEHTKQMLLRRMERSAKRMTNLARPPRKLTRGWRASREVSLRRRLLAPLMILESCTFSSRFEDTLSFSLLLILFLHQFSGKGLTRRI